MAQILPIHVVRQINLWLNDTQHKGRCYILTLLYVIPEDDRFADFTAQTPIADCGIQEKCGNTDRPDDTQNRNPDLKRICAGNRLRCKYITDYRIYYAVHGRNPALDRRLCSHHYIRTDGFGTRNQAQCTLKREWANQSDSHDTPKQNIDPLGSFL